MVMSHRFDARILVQSQWSPLAIELLFIGVERVEIGDPGEFWGASGSVVYERVPVEKRRISVAFDGALNITAERMFVLNRPDWTGPRSRFGGEVPQPDCVPATRIGDQWRQCSSCSDAFEAPAELIYILCPSCGVLTECDLNGAQQSD
jgi:hypothetical protein